MGSSKRGITVAEAHDLVDSAVSKAIREVTWLMAVIIPELMKAPQWTLEDRAKFAAALEGVADSQKADGRTAAATAAAALAEALQAQARRTPAS
jgi:hypothetical protein